ncbi:MAG: hypothetical protein R2710_13280 [Acidimicrobiales bacterium]
MGDYARLYGGIEERLTATEDLRANGATAYAIDRFVTESSAALASSVARERAFMSMWWAVQGALAVGVALSLIAGAALVGSGTITIGTAFLLFQYVLAVSRPLEDVVHQLETMQKANGACIELPRYGPFVNGHRCRDDLAARWSTRRVGDGRVVRLW